MERYKIFENSEYEHAEQSKVKLAELLREMDLPQVQSKFKNLAKKLGIFYPNVIVPEMFHTSHELDEDRDDYMGTYNTGSNRIYIDLDYINELPELEQRFEFVHTVIHEGTHALARKECDGIMDSGVALSRQSNFDKEKFIDLFILFDEAVTETIARKITEEYIESSPYKEELTVGMKENTTYQAYVEFLDEFMTLLSQRTGVSKEVVYEGIVNDYFNGTNLFDPELEKGFEDIFYEGVMQDIARVNNEVDLDAVLKRLKKTKTGILQKTQDRIARKIKDIYQDIK